MVHCREFYEKFKELQEMAKEVKGYCEVDARSQISRMSNYVNFCEKHDLLPFGTVPEGALRPLIAERNADIAPSVLEQVKKRMKSDNPKFATITNSVVRKLIADVRRRTVDTPSYPDKTYRCLVIDPPWPMKKIIREKRPNQYEQLDYSIMSLEEIENIPVSELANSDGCHVYLWVTQKFLPYGFHIFDLWSVKYQCLLTWVKPSGMTPFSWMYNTEHILFGRIGNLPLLKNGIKLSFEAAITKHSEKPDIFFDIVREASSEPRLNMFARKKRKGFDSWGAEVIH